MLAAELPKEVLAIYWAKNMYWRAGKPERFVRPVRWVVALLDSRLCRWRLRGSRRAMRAAGIACCTATHSVVLPSAKSYAEALRAASVVVDVAERQADRFARRWTRRRGRLPGARWREDEALVETVTHLTEWPTVILGDFEPEYLELPEEVLVTVMRDHQKYFAVEDADGQAGAAFSGGAEYGGGRRGRGDHPARQCARAAGAVQGCAVLLGLRPEDAAGGARGEPEDTSRSRRSWAATHWKTEQNLRVASALAAAVEDWRRVAFDEAALLKAVELAKTDLTTELVKEFTELQGIIGGLYARAQGLGETVAMAIYEQYTPASIEDRDSVDDRRAVAGTGRPHSDDCGDVRHRRWRRRDRRIRLRCGARQMRL